MDTEEQQYIKMCDCPEIQDMWKPKVGDLTSRGFVLQVLSKHIFYKICQQEEYVLFLSLL